MNDRATSSEIVYQNQNAIFNIPFSFFHKSITR
jgi:hypothetical protein